MKVSAIFDYEYDGLASGAVWIVDSEQNREWFNRRFDKLDSSSAIFFRDKRKSIAEVLYQLVGNIVDHHPEWTSISVSGLKIADLAGDDYLRDFEIEEAENGFVLR